MTNIITKYTDRLVQLTKIKENTIEINNDAENDVLNAEISLVTEFIRDLEYSNRLRLSKENALLKLTLRHIKVMNNKNVIISVYTNASGFLWNLSMVDSGTDLGWCDHNGDCEMSGTFTTYEKAFEDAINLIDKCDLEKFKKEVPFKKFHWGNYAAYLNKNYR